MLIDGKALIEKQLSLTDREEMIFADGRRTMLTPVRYLPQLVDAQRRVSLDGEWRVKYWPFSCPEEELAAMDTGDAQWASVQQPGKVFTQNVEQCTGGVPGWDRIKLTHIDPEDGALLRRSQLIPALWAGKRIYLCFDAVYPAARFYLNGQLLGEHASGLTPVEWDVTDLVTPGETALVSVRLLRRHPFVQMDMPRHAAEFAGLAQTAYFHATESCQLSDYHLLATLDSSLTRGDIAGTLQLRNHGSATCAAQLALRVTDAEGNFVAEWQGKTPVAGGSVASLDVALQVAHPQLWNDEYPRLYQVDITLDCPGQTTQTVRYRCGFRRFLVQDSRATLNGNPVKFRGVNHLSYHPEHGLYTPEPWLRQCLQLMKRANINCIRTHFLGPRCLADLCDELGIYLMQELPIDWGTNYIHDPLWVGPALQRLQGGILRDRHHPSLMVWSVGNENMPESLAVAGDGHNHLRIYERFVKTLDPSRPTIFPPPGPANTIRGILELRVGDIADTHYSFKLLKDFQRTGEVVNPIAWTGEMEPTTREQAMARGWSGVWFSSEYGIANLMPDLLRAPYGNIIDDQPVDGDADISSLEVFYNRLHREWGYMRDDPSCLGGAYFPWLCAAAGENPWGWTVWAEDNDWGVVTADLLPKPEFWAMRVLFSPVWFPEQVAWHAGEESIRLTLQNQYNAFDLSQCTFRTMCGWAKHAGTRLWRDIPVTCPPGESRTIDFPIWNTDTLKSLGKGIISLYRIVLLDPFGFRPITADIRIVPEQAKAEESKELLIGPDAKL